jgi:hypothetical protein
MAIPQFDEFEEFVGGGDDCACDLSEICDVCCPQCHACSARWGDAHAAGCPEDMSPLARLERDGFD